MFWSGMIFGAIALWLAGEWREHLRCWLTKFWISRKVRDLRRAATSAAEGFDELTEAEKTEYQLGVALLF